MGSNLKKAVRARMAETGDGWQKALNYVRSRADVARGLLPTAPDDPMTQELVDRSFAYEPKIDKKAAEAFMDRIRWEAK